MHMVERLIDMLAQLTPLTGRLPLSCRPLSSVGQPSYYADRPYADRPYADRPLRTQPLRTVHAALPAAGLHGVEAWVHSWPTSPAL
jgi:hypothetical protein